MAALVDGRTYTWEELGSQFSFKPDYLTVAGGMISRPQAGVVLLMTHPGGARSFDYGDYWDGDDLIYTGRGKKGDQRRVGANRDVGENTSELYVFEPADRPRELRFLGHATCVGEWASIAPDEDGRQRQVLRFRLRFPRGHKPATKKVEQPARHEPALRRARAFDPERPPKPASENGVPAAPEEILALQEKARQGHHVLLTKLAAWLAAYGWHGIEEIPGAVDLWATRETQRVLFEAKTLGGENIERVRGALGQLLEYRYFYGAESDQLCIVADRPVSERRCRMLDSLGVAVLWREADDFRAGSRVAADVFATDARDSTFVEQ